METIDNVEDIEVTDELLSNPEDELMLSTSDNPYNPKTDYEKWRRWDVDNGYNTEEYLSRLTDVPDDVDMDDDITISKLVNKAVQDILDNDDQGIYILV